MPDSLNNILPKVNNTILIGTIPKPMSIATIEDVGEVQAIVVPRPVQAAPKKILSKTLLEQKCTPMGLKNSLFTSHKDYLIYKESISNIPVKASAIYGTTSTKFDTDIANREIIPPKSFVNYSIIAIALFFIYVVIRTISKSFISGIIRSTVFYKSANKQFDLRYNKENKYRNLYHVLYVIVVSIFVFVLLNSPKESYGYLTNISIICLVLGVNLLQLGSVNLSGSITKSEELTKRLNFERQTICGVVGVLLLPVSILMLLYKDTTIFTLLTYVGLSLIMFPLLFVFLRSFVSFFNAQISGFFWFLYLCVFEIAPYCVLYFIISEKI